MRRLIAHEIKIFSALALHPVTILNIFIHPQHVLLAQTNDQYFPHKENKNVVTDCKKNAK